MPTTALSVPLAASGLYDRRRLISTVRTGFSRCDCSSGVPSGVRTRNLQDESLTCWPITLWERGSPSRVRSDNLETENLACSPFTPWGLATSFGFEPKFEI